MSFISAPPGKSTYVTVGSSGADYTTDGTADDVQIQQAIDAVSTLGGTVYIKPGTYDINATVQLKDNVTVMGAGINATILRAKNSLNANILATYTAASGNVFFVRVCNLTIDGNKTNNSSGVGIYGKFAHTWLVEDVHVKYTAGHCIHFEATGTGNIALNNWLKNVRVEDPLAAASSLFFGSYAPNNHILNVIGSSVAGGTASCIKLYNDEITMLGCHISGSGAIGVDIQGSNNVIEGNYVEASTTNGIEVINGVSGNRIIGNVVFNSGYGGAAGTYSGVKVSGQKNEVLGNRMFDRQATKTQDYGIELTSTATDNIISNNNILAGDHTTGDILVNATALVNNVIKKYSTDTETILTNTLTSTDKGMFLGTTDRFIRYDTTEAAVFIANQSSTGSQGRIKISYSSLAGGNYFDLDLYGVGSVMRADGNRNVMFGTTSDTSSNTALVQVVSTTKGFLPPVMTTTQRDAISSPQEGLVVYNSTLHKLNVRGAATWETVTSV